MMAETDAGMWAARTTGRAESRQNGKGDEIEVVESWGLTQRAEAIVHTAHEIPTAKSAHLRLVAFLEGHRDLRRLLSKVRYANGDQAIEMHNDGIIAYRTRTSGGGRGLDDISRLVVDEAQYAQPEQLASATPILAVAPNPQTNFMGSGGITERSEWWWTLRLRALRGGDGRFSWLEHSAESVTLVDGAVLSEPPQDPSDRDVWRRANPGYPARISDDYLAEQLELIGPELFAREHLCVWDPALGQTESGEIDPDAWHRVLNPHASPDGALVVGYAVAQDRSWSSIGVSDGVHVEVVRNGRGTAWLATELPKIVDGHDVREVVCVPNGPVGAVLADVEASVDEVRKLTGPEWCQASMSFAEAVTDGRLTHIGQAELDRAVHSARARKSGDSWSWSREGLDVSPLEALSVARWAATASESPTAFLYVG